MFPVCKVRHTCIFLGGISWKCVQMWFSLYVIGLERLNAFLRQSKSQMWMSEANSEHITLILIRHPYKCQPSKANEVEFEANYSRVSRMIVCVLCTRPRCDDEKPTLQADFHCPHVNVKRLKCWELKVKQSWHPAHVERRKDEGNSPGSPTDSQLHDL